MLSVLCCDQAQRDHQAVLGVLCALCVKRYPFLGSRRLRGRAEPFRPTL